MSDNARRSLNDWLEYLSGIDPDRIELGLSRVNKVLDNMDLRDFGKTKIIEIAGTNGKGSTAALIAGILELSGYKTGLYTSPHLHRFNERIMIGGRTVSDESLAEAFAEVERCRDVIDLTYFEYTTLAALYLFKKQSPDVLVLEIGLGGRLDAVNAIDADIAVITSIGMDHMALLGSTETAIAREKAGIIKHGSYVVTGVLSEEAHRVVKEYSVVQNATLTGENHDFTVQVNSDGTFDYRNIKSGYELRNLPAPLIPQCCCGTVLTVIGMLCECYGFCLERDGIEKGLKTVVLPGRMQKIGQQPDIYLDVAHNVPAAAHLRAVLEQKAVKGDRIAVIGMLRDKDVEGVLSEVAGLFKRYYVSTLHTGRGENAQRLKIAVSQFNGSKCEVTDYNNVSDALNKAIESLKPDDELIVFGSFVTVSEALDYFNYRVS